MPLVNLSVSRYLGILPNLGIPSDYCACVLIAWASFESGKLREMSHCLIAEAVVTEHIALIIIIMSKKRC